MCLILFALGRHRDYPLVVIANRDEYYARPSRAAHWWDDAPVFAGRDLQAGGTWLGVDRRGRFAAVTNVREPGGMTPGERSRGELPRDFLAGEREPRAYLAEISARGSEYSGFNLLVGDRAALWFYSNRGGEPIAVEPGVYGISNGAFDEDWPKLASARSELATLLAGSPGEDALLEILTDHRTAPDHALPSTGVPLDVERLLSSRFIRSPDYGTRACSVLLFDNKGEVRFSEHNFVDATHAGEVVRERILPE
ncbi:MAG: NRDE family protein [Gammaproteobacteria bacterium]|nr:NRDE family protein [Gammaproteobacteria bacterium]